MGGVVGAALIAGVIIFFVMKKKRSRIPPSAQFAGAHALPSQPTSAYTDSTPFPPQMAQPKLYVSGENPLFKNIVSDNIPGPV